MFKNFKEAYAFSYEAEIELGKAPTIEQVKASLPALSNVPFSPSQEISNNYLANSNSPAVLPNNQNSNFDVEKLPYSAPKKPDINQMRLFVENDNFEQFLERISSNPRYLISAGDSPVIVQVGFFCLFFLF